MPDYIYLLVGVAAFASGYYYGRQSYTEKTGYAAEPVPEGGWRCPRCGKPHASYDSFCSCGEKRENTNSSSRATPEANGSNAVQTVRQYKQLLDEGILTQEKFDNKKKQLLGL